MASGADPLPTVVIGGYLGAGKTTLVNHLLRHAAAAGDDGGGRRIAVLVNDFGEVSIDADLIEGADGEVLSLAGGCICCSFGADLVGTLAAVARRVPRPDAVLIETSGVGLPAAVARTAALVPVVRIESIVVLADALALRHQAGARHVGETVRQQLHEADLVIVGKTDLVDEMALGALLAWLREAGVSAPIMPMPVAPHLRAAALTEIVFGKIGMARVEERPELQELHERPKRIKRVKRVKRPRRPFAPRFLHAVAPADTHHVAVTRRFAEPVDVAALGEELRAQGVLRAKGLLLDLGGRWHELHIVGRRVDVRMLSRPPAGQGDAAGTGPEAGAGAGQLVVISLREG